MGRRILLAATMLVSLLVVVGVAQSWDWKTFLGWWETFLGWWDWKTAVGWKPLVEYINPGDATERKETLQVYAVIVAGVIASITAAVGLANLRLTRKNLVQQRELEAERAQHTALQAYYEQIGKLLTEYDLRNTNREDIRELARGQTATVLQQVDVNGKGSLLTFLAGAGLIGTEPPIVALTGADLEEANLQRAYLQGANLQRANLQGANLHQADLAEANFQGANLQGANLRKAKHLNPVGIAKSVGDRWTRLPRGYSRPEMWSKSTEEQVKIVRRYP